MLANIDSGAETRKGSDQQQSLARRAYLTRRVQETIEMTESLAEELEVELAKFARGLRDMH